MPLPKGRAAADACCVLRLEACQPFRFTAGHDAYNGSSSNDDGNT